MEDERIDKFFVFMVIIFIISVVISVMIGGYKAGQVSIIRDAVRVGVAKYENNEDGGPICVWVTPEGNIPIGEQKK